MHLMPARHLLKYVAALTMSSLSTSAWQIKPNFARCESANICYSIVNPFQQEAGTVAFCPDDSVIDKNWMFQREQQKFIGAKQIKANSHLEDRVIAYPVHTSRNGPMLFAAVIDGHGGWQVAECIQAHLPSYVHEAIEELSAAKQRSLTQEELGQALTNAFERLDAAIESNIRKAYAMRFSRTAKVGACCAAVLITPNWLIVANVGDCAIVLERGNKILPLTSPHNVNVLSERKKTMDLHPNEPDAVSCKTNFVSENVPLSWKDYPFYWFSNKGKEIQQSDCYLKGRLQVNRSFGDFYLKTPEFQYDYESFKPFIHNAQSYPYVTVKPELQYHRLNPKTDQFLVLASDGVWDFLSKKEAADVAKNSIKKSPVEAANKIVRTVLEKAASAASLDYEEMIELPFYRRRSVYDDTTACVIDLQELLKEGFLITNPATTSS